jgi:hypothetical protein
LPFKRYGLNVKVFADRQTGQKLYAPDLSIRRHKKNSNSRLEVFFFYIYIKFAIIICVVFACACIEILKCINCYVDDFPYTSAELKKKNSMQGGSKLNKHLLILSLISFLAIWYHFMKFFDVHIGPSFQHIIYLLLLSFLIPANTGSNSGRFCKHFKSIQS